LSAAARLHLFLIGGGGSKFQNFFRLSAAAAARNLKFFSPGGGGSKFKNFFRLSAAAGKFKNEKFFRK
jgi:hypothetical protein